MYLGTGHAEHGADMNIRGGQAGFLRSLVDGQYLAWPDYVGMLGCFRLGRVWVKGVIMFRWLRLLLGFIV